MRGLPLTSLLEKFPLLKQLKFDFLQNIRSFKALLPNGEDMLFIGHDRNLWSFGMNKSGMLGLGHEIETIQNPIQVSELNQMEIVDIQCGHAHVMALLDNGDLYGWGENEFGQCGLGFQTEYLRPKKITHDERIAVIKCGWWYSMVLTRSGQVHAWGLCPERQDAEEISIPQWEPERVEELGTDLFVAIDTGAWHSMALNERGQVFTWGFNEDGQLGNGNFHDQTSPFKVQIEGVRSFEAIAAGKRHSLLLTTDGEIYVCGDNQHGQLGITTFPLKVSSPVKLEHSTRFKSIGASLNLSVGLSESGHCFIWGQTFQLGNIVEPLQTEFTSIDLALSNFLKLGVTPYLTSIKFPESSNLVMDRFSSMFNQAENSDFNFSVGGKTIYAHRAYLQLSSSYLNRMLSTDWSQDSSITIDDFEYPIFFAYLKFLYTGKFDLDSDQTAQLLSLSHRYIEPALTDRCVSILQNEITLSNCCLLYELSVRFELKSFEEQVIKFMKRNISQILSLGQYQYLAEDLRFSLGEALGGGIDLMFIMGNL